MAAIRVENSHLIAERDEVSHMLLLCQQQVRLTGCWEACANARGVGIVLLSFLLKRIIAN